MLVGGNRCVLLVLQVSFDAEAALPLASQAVSQLHHVLFACNASFATFKEAWQSLQGVPAL